MKFTVKTELNNITQLKDGSFDLRRFKSIIIIAKTGIEPMPINSKNDEKIEPKNKNIHCFF